MIGYLWTSLNWLITWDSPPIALDCSCKLYLGNYETLVQGLQFFWTFVVAVLLCGMQRTCCRCWFLLQGISSLWLLHLGKILEYIKYLKFPLFFEFSKIFLTVDPTDSSISAVHTGCLKWMWQPWKLTLLIGATHVEGVGGILRIPLGKIPVRSLDTRRGIYSPFARVFSFRGSRINVAGGNRCLRVVALRTCGAGELRRWGAMAFVSYSWGLTLAGRGCSVKELLLGVNEGKINKVWMPKSATIEVLLLRMSWRSGFELPWQNETW